MANRYAVANGNWSNTATWDGGTLPASGDTVRPNNYTVTVDQNVTVAQLRNDASSPAVAGGTFTLTNGITVTATAITSGSSVNPVITFNLASGSTSTVVGDLTGSANLQTTISITNSGTLNWVGTALANTNCPSINVTSGATGATINATGTGTAASGTGYVINIATSITVNWTGTINGGTSTNVYGISCANTGSNITVTGTVNGGASTGATGINGSAMTVTVIGTAAATSTAHAVEGTLVGATIIVSGTMINNVGMMAIKSFKLFIGSAATTWRFKNQDLTTDRYLYSANVLPGSPSVDNVRLGTVYGPSNDLTGLLAVPDPSNVRKGVATDGTAGTAEVTGEDIITALNLSSNPLAERLRNVATVQTTGDQIAALNTEE